jgi:DNA-binding response OmpR family regulator
MNSPSVFLDDAEKKKASETIAARARILIIEDEHIVLKTLAIIFSKAGYETRGVESAEAALELLETEKWIPQLAILDVHLPGMNGIKLAITLKARYPEVRVSLFSGRAATTDLVNEARLQGHVFDDVIAKPVHPTVFLDLVSSLLSEGGQVIDPVQ